MRIWLLLFYYCICLSVCYFMDIILIILYWFVEVVIFLSYIWFLYLICVSWFPCLVVCHLNLRWGLLYLLTVLVIDFWFTDFFVLFRVSWFLMGIVINDNDLRKIFIGSLIFFPWFWWIFISLVGFFHSWIVIFDLRSNFDRMQWSSSFEFLIKQFNF